MTDHEKIQSFGDMVEATEKLTKPWKQATMWTLAALVVTNLILSLIIALLVWLAYMNPVELDQEQQLEQKTQHQTYSQGIADGE